MNHYDVVIVGGGLSGLYVAYLLEKAGVSYVLLEANDRLGGRILSMPSTAKGELAYDLGPTWFWPHQPRIQQLLKDLSIARFEQYEQGDALYQLQRDEKPRRDKGAGSMLSYRVDGGMQNLIQRLEEQLDRQRLFLAHPVTNISRKTLNWRISAQHEGQTQSFCGRHLLLAAPPRVLLQHLALRQWLPAALYQRLLATPTWMAGQAKFVATYPTPFWREAGLSGDAFSRVGPLGEIHDASAESQAGFALFGFLGIPAPSRERYSADQLKNWCLNQLTDLFGEQASRPQASYLKDWALDGWVATPRDVMEPSAHPDLELAPYAKALGKLKLGFASSEVARCEAGYLEGALVAAEVAVSDYLKSTILPATL